MEKEEQKCELESMGLESEMKIDRKYREQHSWQGKRIMRVHYVFAKRLRLSEREREARCEAMTRHQAMLIHRVGEGQ